jgi:hypothetical protein
MSLSTSSTEDEAFQSAFEEFMLGTNKSGASRSSPAPSPSKNANSPGKTNRKTPKHFHTILKAFRGTLVRDWLQVDDNLCQVFHSIANLREQVWQASRFVHKFHEQDTANTITTRNWKTRGYRGSITAAGLQLPDVELALSHSLLQHERMLAGARRLLVALGQAQEALGRRLDELMMQSLQLIPEELDEDIADHVEECQELYKATANELYRKQLLADQVFHSLQDGLLRRPDDDVGPQDTSSSNETSNPRQCSRRCADTWPRSHRGSLLYDWEQRLQELMSGVSN